MDAVTVSCGQKLLPNGKSVLRDVNFQLGMGESVAIVGPSGSGKSTLLAILGLMDKFTAGELSLFGKDVGGMSTAKVDMLRAEHIGFIFQRFSLISHLSVFENVATALRHGNTKHSSAYIRSKVIESLEQVGLAAHWKMMPRTLSGGEQQRVGIARALVRSPAVILADEPTGALDMETGNTIIDLLSDRAQANNIALVTVTHDTRVASRMDRIYELKAGRLSPPTADGRLPKARHRA